MTREAPKTGDAFDQFMLQEIGHAAESLLRNEEDGERRVTVFLTIAGGAGAALAFLAGDNPNFKPGDVNPLFISALVGVLLIGYFTFVRVVERNIASDRFKERLNRARKYFVPDEHDPRIKDYLAFNPYDVEPRRGPRWLSTGRGGWLETIALVDALIAGALVATVVPTATWWRDTIVAAITAALIWVLLIEDAKRRYRNARPTKANLAALLFLVVGIPLYTWLRTRATK